jgi:protein-disulfide isomerase
VFPQLKQKYIDAGKIRFIFRPYPRDEQDLKACVAVGCSSNLLSPAVLTQVMESQGKWMGSKNLARELARVTGIDENRLIKLVNDEQLQKKILENRLEAEKKYKIDATPAFVINGKVYMGLSELKQFDAIINASFERDVRE